MEEDRIQSAGGKVALSSLPTQNASDSTGNSITDLGVVEVKSVFGLDSLLHDLQLRDKIKSAEYHFTVGFDYSVLDESVLRTVFSKIQLLSEGVDYYSFKIGVTWPAAFDEEKKHDCRAKIHSPLLAMVSSELGKRADFSLPEAEFLIDFSKSTVSLRLNPVFVFGRYCKYSRSIAQTEYFCNKCRGRGCWYCNGTGHFSSESVEQLIGKSLISEFGARLCILHGAGREDMDVLMLGKGRPFIAELLIPKKRTADLKKTEDLINSRCKGKISVSSLTASSSKEVAPLKDSLHDKIYAALIHSERPVDFSKMPLSSKLCVSQGTPTRVEKRRANMNREKEVTIVRITPISAQEFVAVLRTSHGTYVKEFISGDSGKTSPSISSLAGSYCTCVLLDVLEICD